MPFNTPRFNGGTITQALSINGVSSAQITITAATAFAAYTAISYRNTTGAHAAFTGAGGYGTLSAPAQYGAANAPVVTLNAQPLNSNLTSFTTQGVIAVLTTAAHSATNLGTYITFSATPDTTTTLTEVMRLNATTGLNMYGANVVIDNNRLFRLRGYTVATLPAGVIGAAAYVSDAAAPAWNVAVVGDGAVVTKVYYNGAAWVAG